MQANQLCLFISRAAKGGTGMVAIAGQCLNMVLEELWLVRNLKVNRVTQSPVVSAATYGPFDLPANYARTYDMWYPLPVSGGGTSGSMTQFLVPITMEQFDAEFKSPSIANYPYEFATDLSQEAMTASTNGAGYFYIYPQTSGSITLTHRYMIKRPALVNPETSSETPWFPHNQYLINASVAQLCSITGDDRQPQFIAIAEKLLAPFLVQEGDEQLTVQSVRLDPRHYRFSRNLRPTKAAPL